VYGLGANALDAKAVGRIFAAKGRPAHNPLIVHVADEAQARRVADGWPEPAEKLAAAFWPGPLTLVLPRAVSVSERVTAGGVTVAVRCPVHPVARSLIAAAGVPVAAPSANHSGELSPTRAEHVTVEGVDLILDGGPCSGGIESTVVDVTRPTVRLLRPGPITVAQLEAVVGRVEVAPRAGAGPLPSPGMLARHYAPRTRLELAETEDEADTLARVYETAGLRVARWRPTGTPAEVAARLYADLHALDAGGYDRIVAALPPDADEWRAVRDRLTRAAAE
jgi:L-threonylcarbamoyladenylate synthase